MPTSELNETIRLHELTGRHYKAPAVIPAERTIYDPSYAVIHAALYHGTHRLEHQPLRQYGTDPTAGHNVNRVNSWFPWPGGNVFHHWSRYSFTPVSGVRLVPVKRTEEKA